MNDPISAREALLIDAIGEATALIDSVGRLTPEIHEISRDFDRASAGLRDSLTRFELQVLALSENAKVQVVKHLLARTDEATRNGIDAQEKAMAKAASTLFETAVDPRIQQLAKVVAYQVDRIGSPWERWCAHAATALASCVATLAVVEHLWPR